MVKSRGLREAKRKIGDLEKIIFQMLRRKKKVRVFESGCGYWRVMVELKKRFGDRIDIVGMNLKPSHGDKKKMISFALKEGIINKNEVKDIKSIKIVFGDAGNRLPFKTGSIDLVYSQVSSYLYKDKMHFLEEVARVLSKEGIARITPFTYARGLPKELLPLLKIYDNGKCMSFERFIKKFKNIKIKKIPSKNEVIEVKKGKLNFGLRLESSINVNNLNKEWFGIQSIYSVKK